MHAKIFVTGDAAPRHADSSYREPSATFATNIMGTANLLDAVRAFDGVTIVLAVTSGKEGRRI